MFLPGMEKLLPGLIAQLSDNPTVVNAMAQLADIRNATIASLNHFNSRLDVIEANQRLILAGIQNPSNTVAAGDDGLFAAGLLPASVGHESEAAIG